MAKLSSVQAANGSRKHGARWEYVPLDAPPPPTTRAEKIRHFFRYSPIPGMPSDADDNDDDDDDDASNASHSSTSSIPAWMNLRNWNPTVLSPAEVAMGRWLEQRHAAQLARSAVRKRVAKRKRSPVRPPPPRRVSGSDSDSTLSTADESDSDDDRSSHRTASRAGSASLLPVPDTWRKCIKLHTTADGVVWLHMRGTRANESLTDQDEPRPAHILDCGLFAESLPCLPVPPNLPERPGWRVVAVAKDHLLPLPQPGLGLLRQRDFELPPALLAVGNHLKRMRKNKEKWTTITKNRFVSRPRIRRYEHHPCACPKGSKCGPLCLNRCMYIECEPETCPAGKSCTNQRFQKGEQVEGLEVRETETRGKGIFTTTPIAKDTLILEYTGEIIDEKTCHARMDVTYAQARHFYFLCVGNGDIIDGTRYGSIARFINHSCAPNCRVEAWTVNGDVSMGIFANEDIAPGSELFYDYNFEDFNARHRQYCFCGAEECRGMLGERREPVEPRVVLRSVVDRRKHAGADLRSLLKSKKTLANVKESRLFLIRNLETVAAAVKRSKPDMERPSSARSDRAKSANA
ncbi:DNA-binding transcription repressor [Allomyces javanicus]|nr:DNA-binding transcription repressor [Allomyces javanicus]